MSKKVDEVTPAPEEPQAASGVPQAPEGGAPATPAWSDQELAALFQALRAGTGVDFTYYKKTTIRRRIGRRMRLRGIPALGNYLVFLERSPSEVHELCQDLLIKVTSFFRDPETFETLKTTVLPAILRGRQTAEPVRIWVPGCATGEEVYSIAIALSECLGEAETTQPIKIFGTDISETALQQARAGAYAEAIARDVSPERLRRFFVRRNGSYHIAKSIRDFCVFARQNVATDPPFSRLDLISCRNLLIYLEPSLQRSLLQTFHYALKPAGFLMLGTAEGVGAHAELFASVNRTHKIFRKVPSPVPASAAAAAPAGELARAGSPALKVWSAIELQRETDRLIMAQYAPPGVVVDDDMQVREFRGRIRPYLEPAPGETDLNLLRMAPEGLTAQLRAAIDQARSSGEFVRREGGSVRIEGELRAVDVEVWPLKARTTERRCYLVMFLDVGATAEREELHVMNEQLETAREELMCSNEELCTLNEELRSSNAELTQASADLRHLLANVRTPILLLDAHLRVRRFTPSVAEVLSATPVDVGRPVGELRSRTTAARLDALAAGVVGMATGYEEEVRSETGQSYSMRIRPCRGADGKIDGAVISWYELRAPAAREIKA